MANKTMTRYLIILLFLVSCTKLRIQVYENTILVDMDGYEMTNDYWNEGKPISLLPAGISDQNKILSIIRSKYSPFKINITTSEALYNATDPKKRMRLVITPTRDFFSNSSNGVAYLGSFSWGDDTPCFVFVNKNLSDPGNIALAGCHEIGHTLRLRHEVDSCGGGLAHGKIMGNPYDADAVFVHNGLNDQCSSVDEFAKIAEVTGWR